MEDGFVVFFQEEFFSGAKSIVMQTSFVFRPNFRMRGEQKSLNGVNPCGREARLQTVLCDY